LDLFEEAEFGFRKAVEWWSWIRHLVVLGWYSSILRWVWKCYTNPLQASEYYPEENEIEYRQGLYYE
jgi:hypothetical protein